MKRKPHTSVPTIMMFRSGSMLGKCHFKGSFVDSLLLSGGEFIVVDGGSKQVLKIIVKG